MKWATIYGPRELQETAEAAARRAESASQIVGEVVWRLALYNDGRAALEVDYRTLDGRRTTTVVLETVKVVPGVSRDEREAAY